MKYKVGDTVCIKSMFDIGTIIDSKGKVGNLPFKVTMNPYCCSRLTIEEVDNVNGTYKMREDPWHLYNDDMIERKVDEASQIQDINNLELSNHQVQDILDDMGMIDENGNCPYTAEEIFKASVEYAKKVMIEKSYMWMLQHFMEFVKIENLGSCAHEITIYDEKLWDKYSKAMEE